MVTDGKKSQDTSYPCSSVVDFHFLTTGHLRITLIRNTHVFRYEGKRAGMICREHSLHVAVPSWFEYRAPPLHHASPEHSRVPLR